MKMTFKVSVFGGVIVFFAVVLAAVFIPVLVWNPPQTVIAHRYSSIEERGRQVFYSNGCNYCHTQYVRAEDTAMGAVSQGGNYVFDSPMILGSERTGPDLSYIGRKRSETWEIEHLKDPRKFSPLSIMPSFEFLSNDDLSAIASYLFALGDRVAQERMIPPPVEYAGNKDPILYPTSKPTIDKPQGWPNWEAAGLQEGKEIYVTYCLVCHGCAGNGLGSYGGTMAVTPADYKQEPFRNMPDDQWFWHVSEGLPGTLMPTWKTSLTEDQRWKVIRYIQQIFSRPIMRDPDEGDPTGTYANLTNPLSLTVEVVDEGKAIFTRECMVCHGDAGRGHGPYRHGLQPSPPDFGDGSYGTLQNPSYTDADYYWRISEGLPWSAMPSWKLQYNEQDRWKLVHYIRVMFTQTEAPPPVTSAQVYPDIYLSQSLPMSTSEVNILEGDLAQPAPLTPSYERGKLVFLQNCAHCHGLAGDGMGWDGLYLNPKPANFHSEDVSGLSDGEFLAKVSFGIQNSAMPTWGEWLTEDQRWDAIYFLSQSFIVGKPVSTSVYDGKIASNVITLSSDNWTGEGHIIDPKNGGDLYATYCVTCHGMDGKGDGPGTKQNVSNGPAPLPDNLPESYIFWRTWYGVDDSLMPPFNWLLPETNVWDITAYVQSLPGQGGGQ